MTIFFRGGKDREGEMRYNPFRITPYLLKVQGKGGGGGEEEPCCLALAERIISGYEGTKTLRLLKCHTRKDRFRVIAVYINRNCLCSPSDPLGQAHLHHHALPGLCLLGSRWQVNKGFTIRFYNGPFWSAFVWMKLITIWFFFQSCAIARIPSSRSYWLFIANFHSSRWQAPHALDAS